MIFCQIPTDDSVFLHFDIGFGLVDDVNVTGHCLILPGMSVSDFKVVCVKLRH